MLFLLSSLTWLSTVMVAIYIPFRLRIIILVNLISSLLSSNIVLNLSSIMRFLRVSEIIQDRDIHAIFQGLLLIISHFLYLIRRRNFFYTGELIKIKI